MLQPRIIPVIQVSNGKQVKTKQFKNTRYIGSPINTAKIFYEMGVHELSIINIDGKLDTGLLRQIAKRVFIPIAYGGGVKTLDDAREVLQWGAEKIVMNTGATEELVEDISNEAGRQSVTVSIDHKDDGSIWSYHGTIQIGYDATNHAKKMVRAGAGEILLNNIDRDGIMGGYNLRILKEVSDAVTVPVTVQGGAGVQRDLKDAIATGAHGAAAGSLFCYQSKRNRKVLINYPHGLSFCRQLKRMDDRQKLLTSL